MTDTMVAPAPAVQAAPVREAPPPQIVRAHGERIRLAEISRNHWRVTAHEDHSIETCLDPAYLWHGYVPMRPGDIVEITNETQDFFLLLMIARIDKETQSILTRLIHACDWTKEKLKAPDLSAAIVENQGSDGWRVRNGTVVLSKSHKTKAEAAQWLAEKRAVLAVRSA